MLVGLDVATKCGYAFLDKKNSHIEYGVIEGEPVSQLNWLISSMANKDIETIGVEDFVAFNIPKSMMLTTTKLIKRIGYYQYYLQNLGYNLEILHVRSVRSQFNLKGRAKEIKLAVRNQMRDITKTTLSDDESDAILMSLYLLKETNINILRDFSTQRNRKVRI
jgi:hypothetical protein